MIFSNAKLSLKIPLIMLTLAILNAGVISSVSLYFSIIGAEKDSEQRLEVIRDQISESVKIYFLSIQNDLVLNAKSQITKEALKNYQTTWDEFVNINQTEYLQKKYIDENSNKLGEKHLLDAAPDQSSYSAQHAIYHPWFRDVLLAHNYYDIFIINPKGDVIYTVYKERDFASNLLNGEWKDSSLGNLFRHIKNNPVQGKVYFEDFQPYSPSGNIPAAFAATPIMDQKTNVFLGVLAYQMPISEINKRTVITALAGKTIEAQLIGTDLL